MANQPRTERQHSELTGKPCIHMSDEDGAVLQVHSRPDQPTGFLVATAATMPVISNGAVVAHAAVEVDVYLTHSQAQELCDYFRNVL